MPNMTGKIVPALLLNNLKIYASPVFVKIKMDAPLP